MCVSVWGAPGEYGIPGMLQVKDVFGSAPHHVARLGVKTGYRMGSFDLDPVVG